MVSGQSAKRNDPLYNGARVQFIREIVKAIILAAGTGNRLGDRAGGLPKCLLAFDGESLLLRHIRLLQRHPVSSLTVVTGYQQESILAELAGIRTALDIETVYNPDFQAGSVVSLHKAGHILESGGEVLLMDADVLYHPDILDILVSSLHPNCFLLDRLFETGDEPVKLCVSAGRPVEFRKKIGREVQVDFQGESVGFFKFSPPMAQRLAERARYYSAEKREEPYEEVIRDLLLEEPDAFGYEDITGIPWLEIDFPEDILRAAREVLPRIRDDVKTRD